MPQSPADAAESVVEGAQRFAAGQADIVEMWGVLNSNLFDLCRDQPLTGDFLGLFQALEAWEVSVGTDRSIAVASAREVARRLADRS